MTSRALAFSSSSDVANFLLRIAAPDLLSCHKRDFLLPFWLAYKAIRGTQRFLNRPKRRGNWSGASKRSKTRSLTGKHWGRASQERLSTHGPARSYRPPLRADRPNGRRTLRLAGAGRPRARAARPQTDRPGPIPRPAARRHSDRGQRAAHPRNHRADLRRSVRRIRSQAAAKLDSKAWRRGERLTSLSKSPSWT